MLRNLSRLDNQPKYLQNEVFNRLFAEAEIARFTKTELREYEDSLKAYRDIKNCMDSAEEKGFTKGLEEGRAKGLEEGRAKGLEEGRAEGRAKGRAEIAKTMIANGFDKKTIAKMTGLSITEIDAML